MGKYAPAHESTSDACLRKSTHASTACAEKTESSICLVHVAHGDSSLYAQRQSSQVNLSSNCQPACSISFFLSCLHIYAAKSFKLLRGKSYARRFSRSALKEGKRLSPSMRQHSGVDKSKFAWRNGDIKKQIISIGNVTILKISQKEEIF